MATSATTTRVTVALHASGICTAATAPAHDDAIWIAALRA